MAPVPVSLELDEYMIEQVKGEGVFFGPIICYLLVAVVHDPRHDYDPRFCGSARMTQISGEILNACALTSVPAAGIVADTRQSGGGQSGGAGGLGQWQEALRLVMSACFGGTPQGLSSSGLPSEAIENLLSILGLGDPSWSQRAVSTFFTNTLMWQSLLIKGFWMTSAGVAPMTGGGAVGTSASPSVVIPSPMPGKSG